MADKLNPEELEWAFDYDPSDPMLGLSGKDLSGPKMSRRTVLRLLAASGALSAASILAACGPAAAPEPTAAPAEEKPAEAATSAPEATMAPEPTAVPEAEGGGELVAGWAGTPEITTLDPAQINQVLQFQIASMVLSGLTHINADLFPEPDLSLIHI